MRALICGAGIAGLTLAYCLERRGLEPLVIERAPELRDAGYMIDFFGSGVDAAERLNLLPALAAIHDPIDRLVFVDATGRVRFSVAYATLRRRLFANRQFNFLRSDYERLLYGRLSRRSAIRFGTTVRIAEPRRGAVSVGLTDGTTETSICWLALTAFMMARPPASMPRRDLVMVTGSKRQVTVYPVRGGGAAASFLHAAGAAAEAAASVPARAATLRKDLPRSRLDGARVDRWLAIGAHRTVRRGQQVRMPRWSRGRAVLLGDAAWCVSPLAGQGAAMAVAGAYVLAEALTNASSVDDAVTSYERRIRRSNASSARCAASRNGSCQTTAFVCGAAISRCAGPPGRSSRASCGAG